MNEREENRAKYGGDLSPKKRMEWDVFYDGKTLKDIPYEETKKYVKKVIVLPSIIVFGIAILPKGLAGYLYKIKNIERE